MAHILTSFTGRRCDCLENREIPQKDPLSTRAPLKRAHRISSVLVAATVLAVAAELNQLNFSSWSIAERQDADAVCSSALKMAYSMLPA